MVLNSLLVHILLLSSFPDDPVFLFLYRNQTKITISTVL
jgi:hypothetical protein